jgi:hypothetical protein
MGKIYTSFIEIGRYIWEILAEKDHLCPLGIYAGRQVPPGDAVTMEVEYEEGEEAKEKHMAVKMSIFKNSGLFEFLCRTRNRIS